MARLSLEPLEPFLFNHRSGDLVSFANPPQSHTGRASPRPARQLAICANGTRTPTNLPLISPICCRCRVTWRGTTRGPIDYQKPLRYLAFPVLEGLIATATHRGKGLSNAVAMEEKRHTLHPRQKEKKLFGAVRKVQFFLFLYALKMT